jgi:hypothetical protein
VARHEHITTVVMQIIDSSFLYQLNLKNIPLHI